jgi:beta-1,4-N-acetylglucosaminyltransferase
MWLNESMHRTLRHQEMENSWKWTPESKLCFVTTGATAPFTALIESVLSSSTVEALRADGYTHILVQYGTAKDVFTKCSDAALDHLEQGGKDAGLIIEGIDFNPDGLQAQFKLVQQSKGLVISHAGTTSTVELLEECY